MHQDEMPSESVRKPPTRRQMEALDKMRRGLSRQEAARAMGISEGRLDELLAQAFLRLAASSIGEAIWRAQQLARQTVARVWEAINAHDLERYVEAVHEHYVIESDSFPAPVRGRYAARQFMKAYFYAFPDLQFKTQLRSDGLYHVVVFWEATGTHQGEFRGVSPTYRLVMLRGCSYFTLQDWKPIYSRLFLDVDSLKWHLGDDAA